MRDAQIKTVCSFDPAIDKKATSQDAIVALARKRDMSGLRFIPGDQPTVFTLREIPHTLWESFVEDAPNEAVKFARAFRAGVVRVENVYQNDGARIASWTGSGTHESKGAQLQILTEDDLERFSPAERQEIGAAAYWHSFLPRRIVSGFQLPLTSLSILRLAEFQGAESSHTEQDTSSAKPSPETSTQSPDATAIDTAKGGQSSD